MIRRDSSIICTIYHLNKNKLIRERVPPSLSNDVIKLLGVRVPVEANVYDPNNLAINDLINSLRMIKKDNLHNSLRLQLKSMQVVSSCN